MRKRYILLYLLPFLFFTSLSAQSTLYQITGETETEWAGKTTGQIEQSVIDFDRTLLQEIRNGVTDQFQIATTNNELHNVFITRVIEHANGGWSASGSLDNNWMNSFVLSYHEGSVLVQFEHHETEEQYQIHYSSIEGRHHLHKVDPERQDVLGCGLHDSHDLTVESNGDVHSIPESNLTQSDERIVIDVMIVYTPAAANWASINMGGITNVVNQSMAVAQNTIDNSEIDLEFRLVHSALVNYVESTQIIDGQERTDSFTDLYRLTTSPTYLPRGAEYSGYMDEVHEWRDEHSADLVAIFTLADDVGGLGWLITNQAGDSRLAFSLSRVQQAAGTTHVHEMGHNMGKAHSRNQSTAEAGPSGGIFEYSTGWRWTGQNNQGYASVMTYGEGDQGLQIFSNPDVFVEGVPSGSYVGDFAPADNARSIREVKQTVANYRIKRDLPEVITESIFNITAGRAEGEFRITDEADSPVTQAGICWSRSPNPGRSDNCSSVLSPGDETITVDLTDLNGNRAYYARAFAENNEGTGFGEDILFRTEDISPNQSLISASLNRILATGQQESEIEVTVLNSSAEPVSDARVELTESGGSSTIVQENNRTDSNGVVRFTITGDSEAEIEYSAIAEDLMLNQRTTIEFLYSEEIIKLGHNFPNPFQISTSIPIVVEEPGRVTIEIYNALGSKVKTVIDREKPVGYFEIPFDAGSLASGVYFYRYTTPRIVENEKMILVR